jgi:hypothetical protein
MFYVIEFNYVGPNLDQYCDADTIEIRKNPPITNSSKEICIEGWCGTTSDWSVYAHGEYPTIEEARKVIANEFGEVRNFDIDDSSSEYEDDDVIEIYKLGKYGSMSSQETAEWAYDWLQEEIKANTTDERILELVAEFEAEANRHGGTLHSDLFEFMEQHREGLRADLENENEN